ncbi:MAG: hypothetical protein RID91_15685 [Azospirillaceae bacterium]
MATESTNIDRLRDAGVIDDRYLTPAGREMVESIDLTDDEIAALRSLQEKAKLAPLHLGDPDNPVCPVWML